MARQHSALAFGEDCESALRHHQQLRAATCGLKHEHVAGKMIDLLPRDGHDFVAGGCQGVDCRSLLGLIGDAFLAHYREPGAHAHHYVGMVNGLPPAIQRPKSYRAVVQVNLAKKILDTRLV